MKKPIDDAAIARVSERAICDPRTVLRFLTGLPVRGKVALRIREALALEGYPLPRAAPAKKGT